MLSLIIHLVIVVVSLLAHYHLNYVTMHTNLKFQETVDLILLPSFKTGVLEI